MGGIKNGVRRGQSIPEDYGVSIQVYKKDKELLDALHQKLEITRKEVIHYALTTFSQTIILIPAINNAMDTLRKGLGK